MTKRTLFVLMLAGIFIGGSGPARTYADEHTFQRSAGKMQSFGKAAFSFGIDDLHQDGNIVTFTIPADARHLDEQADAGEVSGLYDLKRGKPSECPLVESTAVSKKIEHYDMMSGRAQIRAHFDDPNMASAAINKGCLLIHDPN